MNRRFRLATLERLRAGTVAEAARLLGAARREVAAAIAYREQLRGQLRSSEAPRRGAPYEQESAAARRARLREELGRAGERVSAAQSRELAAIAAWNAARADLKAVEALHERHRMQVAEADARIEQKVIDELAAAMRRPDPGGDLT
ncbi:MAG TPA: flagellar FliJ family protein [Kineosporiaceae bacterium]